MPWLEREKRLIGENNVGKLKKARIAIAGIGGVGSFTAEAIARTGVGRIFIIDNDTVSESNINRQLVADTTTIGRLKVDIMRERILKINPACDVVTSSDFITPGNASEIINSFSPDYLADCIDNISAKIALISHCLKSGIGIISCMGTGNKLDPTRFRVTDISKTTVCPLARIIRKELKKGGYSNVDVLFSDEKPFSDGLRTPASIAFVPSAAGLIIASHIVRKIIGDISD